MNISTNSHLKIKKKILCDPCITFSYPELNQKKILLALHAYLIFISYALQLNDFSFSHLNCTNKLSISQIKAAGNK